MNLEIERKTVEPGDLFRVRVVQDGVLSPDGAMVAYTVVHVDEEAEKERVTIWLHTLATGEARQLTVGLHRDTGPQWSPDGSQIAFVS